MSTKVILTSHGNSCIASNDSASALGYFVILLLASFVSPIVGLVLSVVVFLGHPSRQNAVACAASFGIAMALISYNIEYNHAVDMTRWMAECTYYTGRPISSIFTSLNQDHESLLAWNLWCWAVGNSGDLKLLQATAAFFGYGILSWLFMDACAREKTPCAAFVAVFVFVLLAVPMQTIVGSVRSTLACVICCVAFYVRSPKDVSSIAQSLMLVLTACLIHKSMIVALGIWLLQPLIMSNPKKMALLFGVGVYIVISVSNYLLSARVFAGFSFLEDALSMADFYTEGTEWDQVQAANFLQIANHAIRVAMLALLLVRVAITGQNDGLWPLMLVGTLSVLAMEATLVNVGLRFQYIPLLIGTLMLLNNAGRDRALQRNWALLIDPVLIALAVAVAVISLRDFIPSFNYLEVASAATFFPMTMFWA